MEPVLYYKHEATKDPVVFMSKSAGMLNFWIPNTYLVDDWMYICIVYDGKVWAGRSIHTPNISNNVVKCAPFSDNQTGKSILLKHYLLYGE